MANTIVAAFWAVWSVYLVYSGFKEKRGKPHFLSAALTGYTAYLLMT